MDVSSQDHSIGILVEDTHKLELGETTPPPKETTLEYPCTKP